MVVYCRANNERNSCVSGRDPRTKAAYIVVVDVAVGRLYIIVIRFIVLVPRQGRFTVHDIEIYSRRIRGLTSGAKSGRDVSSI